ncbi:hypothetical protein BJY52DRAFT_1227688 [Lactarius psammicola]|nr:hypothetical protein BJY52DRAFT_1227688 [Lactarius psammicola]
MGILLGAAWRTTLETHTFIVPESKESATCHQACHISGNNFDIGWPRDRALSDIVLEGAVDFCFLNPDLYSARACNNETRLKSKNSFTSSRPPQTVVDPRRKPVEHGANLNLGLGLGLGLIDSPQARCNKYAEHSSQSLKGDVKGLAHRSAPLLRGTRDTFSVTAASSHLLIGPDNVVWDSTIIGQGRSADSGTESWSGLTVTARLPGDNGREGVLRLAGLVECLDPTLEFVSDGQVFRPRSQAAGPIPFCQLIWKGVKPAGIISARCLRQILPKFVRGKKVRWITATLSSEILIAHKFLWRQNLADISDNLWTLGGDHFQLLRAIQAIPHTGTEDGVFDFFIPKGALVIGDTWAIFRDPFIYLEFKPERFLNPDGSLHDDPLLSPSFGYGRRICPGRHFVDTSLFIYAASLLSVFHIEHVHDSQGRRSEYKYRGQVIRYTPFFVRRRVNKLIACSHPESFPSSITARDKRVEELIIADTMAR